MRTALNQMPQANALVGEALLEFIQENPKLDKYELAKGAGYYKLNPDNTTKPQASLFMDALALASGIKLAAKTNLRRKAKSYKTKRHNSGIVLVGRVYIEELLGEGCQNCDFNIIVDKESESIVLEKI